MAVQKRGEIMELRKISVSEIKRAPYNPRVDLRPGESEYEKLKTSIETFGYVDPLIWNARTGNLVGGNQRFKILLERGIGEVEVSVVDLSLEKEKILNIALNKIQGRWEEERLAVLLEELQHLPEVDLCLTGFESLEIDNLIEEYMWGESNDRFNVSDEADKIITPVTQRGDLIQVGPHRILCGDSNNADELNKLMAGDRADLLYCDPPYKVAYNSESRPTSNKPGEGKRKWELIKGDDMSQEEYEGWLRSIFTNMREVLSKGAPCYIWNGHRQFGPMHLMLSNLRFKISNVITWVKPSPAPSYADYQMQSEFCLYFWLDNNGAHKWYGPNTETNVWQVGRDPAAELIHPTQKPIELAQRAIKNSSKQGDIVLDLFLGSGSTIIASEKLKRKCYGIEIDPRYCDAIVKRYIECFSGNSVSEEVREKYIGACKNVI